MDEQANDVMQPTLTELDGGRLMIEWKEQEPDYVKISPSMLREIVRNWNAYQAQDLKHSTVIHNKNVSIKELQTTVDRLEAHIALFDQTDAYRAGIDEGYRQCRERFYELMENL